MWIGNSNDIVPQRPRECTPQQFPVRDLRCSAWTNDASFRSPCNRLRSPGRQEVAPFYSSSCQTQKQQVREMYISLLSSWQLCRGIRSRDVPGVIWLWAGGRYLSGRETSSTACSPWRRAISTTRCVVFPHWRSPQGIGSIRIDSGTQAPQQVNDTVIMRYQNRGRPRAGRYRSRMGLSCHLGQHHPTAHCNTAAGELRTFELLHNRHQARKTP